MGLIQYKKKNNHIRFPELDILRGLALGIMILLHFLWDLDYFGIHPLDARIYQYQRIPQIMFFSIIGICLVISKNNKLNQYKTINFDFVSYYICRGLKIFTIGVFISIFTLVFIPETPVIFGVMHFIGLSIIMSLLFYKFKYYNIIFASFFIILGVFLRQFSFENPSILHLILGFYPRNIWQITIDYFPIIPWFGWILIGMFLGEVFYKNNKRIFDFPTINRPLKTIKLLSIFGQNSLIIYIIHQPIIAGLITIYLFF
jgi:uncharacterized membrane protein